MLVVLLPSLFYHRIHVKVPDHFSACLELSLELGAVSTGWRVAELKHLAHLPRVLHYPLTPRHANTAVRPQRSDKQPRALLLVCVVDPREEVGQDERILDAHGGARAVEGAARVGGVAGETHTARRVRRRRVLVHVEDGVLADLLRQQRHQLAHVRAPPLQRLQRLVARAWDDAATLVEPLALVVDEQVNVIDFVLLMCNLFVSFEFRSWTTTNHHRPLWGLAAEQMDTHRHRERHHMSVGPNMVAPTTGLCNAEGGNRAI